MLEVMSMMELRKCLTKKINTKMSKDLYEVYSVRKNDIGVMGGKRAHMGKHHGW